MFYLLCTFLFCRNTHRCCAVKHLQLPVCVAVLHCSLCTLTADRRPDCLQTRGTDMSRFDCLQTRGTDASRFDVGFWQCMMPTISSISPSTVAAGDSITISGTGFSTTDCQNEV